MYTLEKLVVSTKLVGTNYYQFGVKSNEIQGLVFSLKFENSSGGITGLNPITVTLQTTWNDGMSWENVSYTWNMISGDGYFKGVPATSTPRLGPICRLVVVIPAGESSVATIWKPTMNINDPYMFMSNNLSVSTSTGFVSDGVPVDATSDSVTPANNKPLPTEIYAGQGEGPLAKTVTGNTQYSNGTDFKMFPSVMLGFDGINSVHKEVTLNPDGSLPIALAAKTVKSTIFYSHTVPVTTLAWTEIEASTVVDLGYLDIFDSSGELLVLGIGAAGSEVVAGYIFPGGCTMDIVIPAGSRLAVKAISADTADGFLTLNAY